MLYRAVRTSIGIEDNLEYAVGVGTTPGDRPVQDGAGYADERAASLRRMFPSRPATGSRPFLAPPPVSRPLLSPPPPAPAPVPEPEPAPARRRRGRLAAVAVVLALTGAGAAVAYQLRGSGAPQSPPVEVAKGFPAVTPPTSGTPSSPAAARSTSAKAPVGRRAGSITAYSACAGRAGTSFTATFTDGFVYRHVFVDADGDARTGHRIKDVPGGFGADYMLENGTFHESTGPGWAWRPLTGHNPRTSVSAGAHTWRLGPGHGAVRAVFNGSDGAGTEVYSPIVKIKGC